MMKLVEEPKKSQITPESYVGFATIKAQNLGEAATVLNRFTNLNTKQVTVIETLPMMNHLQGTPELEILVHVAAATFDVSSLSV
jgi:hypothetical protein